MLKIEKLVTRGHDEHDVIYRYSLAKIDAYIDAAEKNEVDESMRVAQAYHDPKGLMSEAKARRRGNAAMSRDEAARLSKLARGSRKRV